MRRRGLRDVVHSCFCSLLTHTGSPRTLVVAHVPPHSKTQRQRGSLGHRRRSVCAPGLGHLRRPSAPGKRT